MAMNGRWWKEGSREWSSRQAALCSAHALAALAGGVPESSTALRAELKSGGRPERCSCLA